MHDKIEQVPSDLFNDRSDAGKALAEKLKEFGGRRDVVLLALPRGGVPVAFEVARKLELPLDVFIVRKLGVPGHEELAMGAIASGGIRVLNEAVVKQMHISDKDIAAALAVESRELERRERAYRAAGHQVQLEDRTVVLIDDGLATGTTMRAAVKALRAKRPAKIVVAVPVGAKSSCEELKTEAEQVICLRMPEPLYAIGQWYKDFRQTSDEEVRFLLDELRGDAIGADKEGSA